MIVVRDVMTEARELLGVTIAGKYRIRGLVGVGGMGTVYEGEHAELGKRVAIKIIDHASSMSTELTTRFKREARAASAVESEHIVQVFDVGRDPDVGLYMVMEYLVGEDLEMRLRREPDRRLEPVVAAGIAHQVARALRKAHAARVIHRDLKPANIFLTDRDDGSMRVKVLDFGISKLLASEVSITGNREMAALTQEGVALGTPQYMSPEQAQGLTTIDHRTDIWSLGAVLYEAIAGRAAYPAMPSYEQVIMKILFEPPPPLAQIAPWVPEALANVIHDALQKDVGRRIPDCLTFANRLEAAVPSSSGPFIAVRSLAGLAAASLAPTPISLARTPIAVPSIPPIDDTQVVIRGDSMPGDESDESQSSRTMIASGTPPRLSRALVRPQMASRPPKEEVEDDAPTSTADPTMFQPPVWVDRKMLAPPQPVADPSSTTLSTTFVAARLRSLRATHLRGIATAALTAFIVIAVGGALLLISGPGVGSGAPADETAAPQAPASPPVAASDSLEMAGASPAPPATGTQHAAEHRTALPRATRASDAGAAPGGQAMKREP